MVVDVRLHEFRRFSIMIAINLSLMYRIQNVPHLSNSSSLRKWIFCSFFFCFYFSWNFASFWFRVTNRHIRISIRPNRKWASGEEKKWISCIAWAQSFAVFFFLWLIYCTDTHVRQAHTHTADGRPSKSICILAYKCIENERPKRRAKNEVKRKRIAENNQIATFGI